MNQLNIIGNLAADAEKRSTANGSMLTWRMGVKTGYGQHETTEWFGCMQFGKIADGEYVNYLKKGQQVRVTGEVSLNEYEVSGEKRAGMNVVVDKSQLLGKKQDPGTNAAPAQKSPAAGRPMAPAGNGDFDDDVPF